MSDDVRQGRHADVGAYCRAIETSKGLADRTRSNLKDKIDQVSQAAQKALDRTEESYERAADWASHKLTANREDDVKGRLPGGENNFNG